MLCHFFWTQFFYMTNPLSFKSVVLYMKLLFGCLFCRSFQNFNQESYDVKVQSIFLPGDPKILSSVQWLSRVQFFVSPWTPARQASLSITNSQSRTKPISTESVMPSNHLTLCHPLLLLYSIFPSIRVFSNELALLIRWPKYWSFSFNIKLSNEHPGLISFRMDWLDVLAVQCTLKSLLQHHSSKASILQHPAFYIVHFHIHAWPVEKP